MPLSLPVHPDYVRQIEVYAAHMEHKNDIIENEQADMVMLARAVLRNPNWPQTAAIELDQTDRIRIPVQYYLAWKDSGEFSYIPVSAPTLE